MNAGLLGVGMTSFLDQATRLKQSNKPAASNANQISTPDERLVPGVFLMTNSLETGGTERQFVAVAQSLDSISF
ncbi:MAG: hypothetical protein DMG88_05790, partial [Acidobacteria bacterium]